MLVSVPGDRAPLLKYAGTPHLQRIRQKELVENLASRGFEITGGGPGVIHASLRSLAIANGSIENGKVELLQILQELNADAVTIEAADVTYILGRENVLGHAIGRGLESGVAGLEKLLNDVPITEGDPDDKGRDAIPLFDRLGLAADFVLADRIPEGFSTDAINRGVAEDLRAHGLLGPDDNYAEWMEPRPEKDPLQLPRDFQTEAKPYRSAFEE